MSEATERNTTFGETRHLSPRYKTETKSPPIEERKALIEMIQKSPRSANFWYHLGVYLKDQGNLEEAEDAFLTTVELDGNFREAWLNLVWIYEILGMREEAVMAIEMLELSTEEENDLLNIQFFGDDTLHMSK
ncbi:MAG: hypothetical protein BAJATHORv1_10328 [Candidatus Thorarchaeota archaeon]|nr:MAG: hypothetical protein BAJATHORv1_10328 [Candidatus Thorarchaeota archaeon]